MVRVVLFYAKLPFVKSHSMAFLHFLLPGWGDYVV